MKKDVTEHECYDGALKTIGWASEGNMTYIYRCLLCGYTVVIFKPGAEKSTDYPLLVEDAKEQADEVYQLNYHGRYKKL